jgi:exopolysaccharide biosynthesis polyprenyl glycosylphosphotransferase
VAYVAPRHDRPGWGCVLTESFVDVSIDAAPRVSASKHWISQHAFVVGRIGVAVTTMFVVFVASQGLGAAVPYTVATAAVWLLALQVVGSNRALSQPCERAVLDAALGATVLLAAAILVGAILNLTDLSPTSALALLGATAVATLSYDVFAAQRFAPRPRVLIVGSAPAGVDLMVELRRRRDVPFTYVGIVADDHASWIDGALGVVTDLPEIIERERLDLVVLAGGEDSDRVMQYLFDAASSGFRILDVRHFYEHAFGCVPLQNLTSEWFISILHLYRRPYPRMTKRALDLGLAVTALIVFAPLLPVVALLVLCSGPGPILFRQVRIGEGGRPFKLYKFRTMVADAEADGVAVWAAKGDARVTPVGRILRRTRLDELPQVWNVLRGDMSIVGPRPERPEFIQLLAQQVPFWTRRHLVKPGITGWAQLRCGYTNDAVGAAEKLSYDLYYLKHRSLLLDLTITARTAAVVFTGSGAQ